MFYVIFSSSVFSPCFWSIFWFWKLRISLPRWCLLSDLWVTFSLPHPSKLDAPESWCYTDPGQSCWHSMLSKAFLAPQKPEEQRSTDFPSPAFLWGMSHCPCKRRWSLSAQGSRWSKAICHPLSLAQGLWVLSAPPGTPWNKDQSQNLAHSSNRSRTLSGFYLQYSFFRVWESKAGTQ